MRACPHIFVSIREVWQRSLQPGSAGDNRRILSSGRVAGASKLNSLKPTIFVHFFFLSDERGFCERVNFFFMVPPSSVCPFVRIHMHAPGMYLM